MNKIAVLGLGKVGSLVANLLSKNFEVIGIDNHFPNKMKFDYPCQRLDVTDKEEILKVIKNVDAVVSCLTYYLNKPIAKLCVENATHYFDLTEDIETTDFIKQISQDATSVAIPQCGLAPGFIGIVGFDLTKKFDKLRDVELRVGALPQNPNGLLGYSFTWSPAGVINEYIRDSEVIHNGERKMVASLEGIEQIQIQGKEFEAFTTSGGLGTLCETLNGKVDTLNYKTIRYPGHAKLMKFMLYELILKDNIKNIEHILTNAKPPVREDIVYVYAAVEGSQNGKMAREEFYKSYEPKIIDGKEWRAISWTTAASIVSVVNLVADGKLPLKGFVKQEDISLDDFLSTESGAFFK